MSTGRQQDRRGSCREQDGARKGILRDASSPLPAACCNADSQILRPAVSQAEEVPD